MKVCKKYVFEAAFRKSMLLKLSVRSASSEFQIIVGAAWQNARLPKTVLSPASWSKQWSLGGKDVMTFEI